MKLQIRQVPHVGQNQPSRRLPLPLSLIHEMKTIIAKSRQKLLQKKEGLSHDLVMLSIITRLKEKL